MVGRWNFPLKWVHFSRMWLFVHDFVAMFFCWMKLCNAQKKTEFDLNPSFLQRLFLQPVVFKFMTTNWVSRISLPSKNWTNIIIIAHSLIHSLTHLLTHSLAVGVIYQAAIPIVLIPLSPEKLLWQDLHDFHKLLGWIGIWHSYLQSKDEFPDLHLPLQLQSFRKETKHLPRSYFSRYELLVLGRGFEVYCTEAFDEYQVVEKLSTHLFTVFSLKLDIFPRQGGNKKHLKPPSRITFAGVFQWNSPLFQACGEEQHWRRSDLPCHLHQCLKLEEIQRSTWDGSNILQHCNLCDMIWYV